LESYTLILTVRTNMNCSSKRHNTVLPRWFCQSRRTDLLKLLSSCSMWMFKHETVHTAHITYVTSMPWRRRDVHIHRPTIVSVSHIKRCPGESLTVQRERESKSESLSVYYTPEHLSARDVEINIEKALVDNYRLLYLHQHGRSLSRYRLLNLHHHGRSLAYLESLNYYKWYLKYYIEKALVDIGFCTFIRHFIDTADHSYSLECVNYYK